MSGGPDVAEGLSEARRLAAEREFRAYDFEGKVVQGESAWSGSERGTVWDLRFYFETDVDGFEDDLADVDHDDPACMRGCFVVVFAPGSDEVVEVRATHHDLPVGRRPDRPAPAFG